MKLEYIGCCFRFEFELFRSNLDLSKYPVGPRDRTFVTQRKLLRGIAAGLKSQASPAGPKSSGAP